MQWNPLPNQVGGRRPETFWSLVVAAVSIVTMLILMYCKIRVGRRLVSDAVLADANCAKICLYLAVLLLAESAGCELTGIGGIDDPGAIGVAFCALKTLQQAAGNLRPKGFQSDSDSLADPAASCGQCARCCGSRKAVMHL